jgi:hypothetical protein
MGSAPRDAAQSPGCHGTHRGRRGWCQPRRLHRRLSRSRQADAGHASTVAARAGRGQQASEVRRMAPGWAVSPHASRRTGSRPKPVRQAANRGDTLSDQSRQLPGRLGRYLVRHRDACSQTAGSHRRWRRRCEASVTRPGSALNPASATRTPGKRRRHTHEAVTVERSERHPVGFARRAHQAALSRSLSGRRVEEV